jgi:hypothetical protein
VGPAGATAHSGAFGASGRRWADAEACSAAQRGGITSSQWCSRPYAFRFDFPRDRPVSPSDI